jgi:hypothetical protein
VTVPEAVPTGSRIQRRWALGWQIALAAYMQLISWIPLGRWNHQPCCPAGWTQLKLGTLTIADALQTFAFALPLPLFWYAHRRDWRWAMWIALVPYAIWLALQLVTWWPPYLFGASANWAAVYDRAFAQETQILPRWGNHLPPDAMHLVLQTMLVGVMWTGISTLWFSREGRIRAPSSAATAPP